MTRPLAAMFCGMCTLGISENTRNIRAKEIEDGDLTLAAFIESLPENEVEELSRARLARENPPRILIATPVKDSEKELPAYFKALDGLNYDRTLIDISLLESDSVDRTDELINEWIDAMSVREDEFSNGSCPPRDSESDSRTNSETLSFYKNILDPCAHFGRISYNRFPSVSTSNDTDITSPTYTTTGRHAEAIQLIRRQNLARGRNELLRVSLEMDHDWVLWLDVDAVHFPPNLIQDLLYVNRDVVAPHVVWGHGGSTYDRNSWWEVDPPAVWNDIREPIPVVKDVHDIVNDEISSGISESLMSRADTPMFEAYGQPTGRRLYMDDYYRLLGANPWQGIPLHGVGTAVLLVNATIHREHGIIFPVEPYKRRVESEGFGLMAFDHGFEPWGLPRYEIIHINSADTPGEQIKEVVTNYIESGKINIPFFSSMLMFASCILVLLLVTFVFVSFSRNSKVKSTFNTVRVLMRSRRYSSLDEN